MAEFSPSKLRTMAACLAALCGLMLIGSLWVQDLTVPAVAALVQGGVYLFIALGLFGRSRLTLYIGMVVPAICAVMRLNHASESLSVYGNLALLGDVLLATMCALILWRSFQQSQA